MLNNSVRLGLERLDARNAPSSLAENAVASTDWLPTSTQDGDLPAYMLTTEEDSPAPPTSPTSPTNPTNPTSPTNPTNPTNPTPVNPENKAPKIVDFKVRQADGGVVKYSGQVIDEKPGGLMVHLTGAQSCLGNDGVKVKTDDDGYFYFEGALKTPRLEEVGSAWADVKDAEGLAAESVGDFAYFV